MGKAIDFLQGGKMDLPKIFILISRIIGGLLLLMAVAWLIVAGVCYPLANRFASRAVRCQGTVVQMNSRTSDNGNTTYYPVFTYTDSAGTLRTSTSASSSNPPQHSVGDKISLLYDPKDPQDVRTNSFVSLWLLPTIFAGIGGIITLPALFFLFIVPIIVRRSTRLPPAAMPPPLPR
jgi:hypothetical protein